VELRKILSVAGLNPSDLRCDYGFTGKSGNTAYFCLHYKNSKGEAGPFGPALSAVILSKIEQE
jgi:hypothetical protein